MFTEGEVLPLRSVWHDRRGFSLVEMIMFIIIVGIGLAGILSVLNLTTAKSADPLIRKQTLSIAESLLEEAEGQLFTFCAKSDANFTSAKSAAPYPGLPADARDYCATDWQVFGYPTEGLSPRSNFINVGNYCSNPGPDSSCTPLVLGNVGDASSTIPSMTALSSSPAGYWATISLTPEDFNGITSSAGAATMNVIHISVTVSHVGGETLTLESYRTRHARPL